MSLIESLIARPNPELALFGQFVGDWDMDIAFYDEDGETIYRGLGLWSFGWVLDGHAIQDVFSYPTDSGRGIGTTLRTYSRDRGEWQILLVRPPAADPGTRHNARLRVVLGPGRHADRPCRSAHCDRRRSEPVGQWARSHATACDEASVE